MARGRLAPGEQVVVSVRAIPFIRESCPVVSPAALASLPGYRERLETLAFTVDSLLRRVEQRPPSA